MADPLEEAADGLYALPPEDFVAGRAAAAKALRQAGEKEAAARVAKLAKPSQVAGVVNGLARAGALDALLEAGARLRSVQLGGGPRDELRSAAAAERAAVDAVLRDAGKLSRALSDRLRTTLHAAALDEDARALIAAGRLVHEPEPGGAWPAMAPGPGGDPKPRQPARPASKDSQRRRPDAEDRERAKAAKAAKAAKDQERERREREKARRREDAERRKLERRLADARAQAAGARERLDEAERTYESACDEVARIEERLG